MRKLSAGMITSLLVSGVFALLLVGCSKSEEAVPPSAANPVAPKPGASTVSDTESKKVEEEDAAAAKRKY